MPAKASVAGGSTTVNGHTFTRVWNDEHFARSCIASYGEHGRQHAESLDKWMVRCREWWEQDPLVTNADGHVDFLKASAALVSLPRENQLREYSDATLVALLTAYGAATDGARPQWVARIVQCEKIRVTRGASAPTKVTSKRAAPKVVRGGGQSSSKRPKGAGKPAAAEPAPPAAASAPCVQEVVELDDDDDFA